MTEFWKDGPTGNVGAPPAPTAAPALPAAAQPSDFWKPSASIGQGGTPEQQRAFADEMVRAGVMSKEAADANLRAQEVEPAPADTRGEEARQFDATFPAARPEEFNLQLGFRWRDAQPGWLNDVNRDTANFLGAMAMPASIGEALAERIFDVNAKIDAMRGPDRVLWLQENKVQLQRLLGDNAPQRLDAAIATLKDRGGPYLALVTAKGIHNDATVAANLILHSERLAARAGMK